MLGADEERPSHPSLGQAQAAEGTVSTVGMRPCGDGGVWTRTGRARRPRVLGAGGGGEGWPQHRVRVGERRPQAEQDCVPGRENSWAWARDSRPR